MLYLLLKLSRRESRTLFTLKDVWIHVVCVVLGKHGSIFHTIYLCILVCSNSCKMPSTEEELALSCGGVGCRIHSGGNSTCSFLASSFFFSSTAAATAEVQLKGRFQRHQLHSWQQERAQDQERTPLLRFCQQPSRPPPQGYFLSTTFIQLKDK